MGRKYSWNVDQLAFLKSHLEEYITLYKAKKGYEAFWVKIRREFNDNFPFLESLFPGREEGSLTAEELKQYDDYRESTLMRIYSFYRREADKSRKALMEVNQPNGSTKKPRKRVYQAAEIYSKMYFKRRLKKQYEEEKKVLNLNNRAALGLKTKIARQRFLEEDETTVAKVLKRLKKENEIIQGGTVSDPTAADYQRAITGIPAYLHSVLFPLMKSTRFTFTVLMGGPSPAKGGKIITSSFHEIGPGVALTYGETEGHAEVIKSYSKYIKSEYDADMCKSLAMSADNAQEYQDLEKWSTDEEDTDSDDEESGGESDGDNSNDSTNSTSAISKVDSLPKGSTMAALSASVSKPLIRLEQNFIDRDITPMPSLTAPPPIISVPSSATPSSLPLEINALPHDKTRATKEIILGVLAEGSPTKTPSPSKALSFPSGVPTPLVFHRNAEMPTKSISTPDTYTGILTDSQSVNLPTGQNLSSQATQPLVDYSQYPQQTPSLQPSPFLNFDGLPSNAFDTPFPNNNFLDFRRDDSRSYPFTVDNYTQGVPLFGYTPAPWDASQMMFPPAVSLETSQLSNPTTGLPPTTVPATNNSNLTTQPQAALATSGVVTLQQVTLAPTTVNFEPLSSPQVLAPSGTDNSEPAPPSLDTIAPTLVISLTANQPAKAPVATINDITPPLPDTSVPITPAASSSDTSITAIQPATAVAIVNHITPPLPDTSVEITPQSATTLVISPSVTSQSSIPHDTSMPPAPVVLADTSSQATDSRSKRPKKPSTRNEKMDLIGTTVPPPRHQTPMENEVPEWFTMTKDHLVEQTLGESWSALVTTWCELEGLLGYGLLSGARTGLPASERPSEWMKWTSKSRNGPGRVLTNRPHLQDPAELGLAVVKWWNTLQPSFRRSDSGNLPLPNLIPPSDDQDSWLPLCRAGPNGLVSVVLLLEWWGLSLPTRSRFQEDSTSLWQEMVADVKNTLGVLKGSVTLNGSKKRKTSDEDMTTSSKKARTVNTVNV